MPSSSVFATWPQYLQWKCMEPLVHLWQATLCFCPHALLEQAFLLLRTSYITTYWKLAKWLRHNRHSYHSNIILLWLCIIKTYAWHMHDICMAALVLIVITSWIIITDACFWILFYEQLSSVTDQLGVAWGTIISKTVVSFPGLNPIFSFTLSILQKLLWVMLKFGGGMKVWHAGLAYDAREVIPVFWEWNNCLQGDETIKVYGQTDVTKQWDESQVPFQ